jgi:pimeloyl-ACP methyl ester carboxylesterase
MRSQRDLELDRLSGAGTGETQREIDQGHIDIAGVSLAWGAWGHGVPVLCLHAAGHASTDFKPLQQQAPEGCRLLLLDWPGHGRSGQDSHEFTVERCVSLLTGFMNAQGVRDAILLGSEFGASVALAFAFQHPARVRGLILCEPAGLIPRKLRRREVSNPERAGQRTQAENSVEALKEMLQTGLATDRWPVVIVLASKTPAYSLKDCERQLAPFLSTEALDSPNWPRLAIIPGAGPPLSQDPARMSQILRGISAATDALDAHRHAWTLDATDWPVRGMNQWKCTHPGCEAVRALAAGENPNHPASS